MPSEIVFDIEANGFLENVTELHCLWFRDIHTNETHDFADQPGYRPIAEGIDILSRVDTAWAHNGLKYDVPVIQKFYPGFAVKRLRDSLLCSRLIWPNLAETDAFRNKRPGSIFPRHLTGSHALEAWGYRLGVFKGEYGKDENGKTHLDAFLHWNPEMHAYCGQDVEATQALVLRILGKNYSEEAIQIEHDFAEVIAMQERHGFAFDVPAAQALYATLVKERLAISAELAATFPPKVVETVFIPKVNNKKMGYVKGVPFTKKAIVEFNPSSRQMIAERLEGLGWKPQEFTPSGQAKIDETVLEGLPWPEAKVLAKHFLIEKRIGQLAEGDQAWLRLERNGRIHGTVITNGAVTGRCTHQRPNVAQVPSVGKPYGAECRALYTASPGKVLVGADLSGLELRCLAHFMAKYDGGEYAKVILEGDIHWTNAIALGLVPPGTVRNKEDPHHKWARDVVAKRFIYAFLYGAGDVKLGSLLEPQASEAVQKKLGGQLRKRFLANLPALKNLIEDVKASAKKGWIKGLDGRRLHIRSDHAALNTLLQSAGAMVAKLATIFAYRELSARGYKFGTDYALVAHIHDELQLEAKKGIADEVGQVVVDAMRRTGEYFRFRVPIDGEYKLGRNWAETH